MSDEGYNTTTDALVEAKELKEKILKLNKTAVISKTLTNLFKKSPRIVDFRVLRQRMC